MARPTKAEIKEQLDALRTFIDADEELIACRIAYAMETAVRWATENTVDWPPLVQEARQNASILRKDMELVRGGYVR